jgi:hypothetical protein
MVAKSSPTKSSPPKSSPKNRSKDRPQEPSEIEHVPTRTPSPRRKKRGHAKPDPIETIDDEDQSVSTTSALAPFLIESKTRTPNPVRPKVRLRRFFSRKSTKKPQASAFDILEDLSFTEEAISRLSRKSSNSNSSNDSNASPRLKTRVRNSLSPDDKTVDALDTNIEDKREPDGSITNESGPNTPLYGDAETSPSWSDRVKEARHFWTGKDAAASPRIQPLSPVQESPKNEEEYQDQSLANATVGLLTAVNNDQPGDNPEEIPYPPESPYNLAGANKDQLGDNPKEESPFKIETTYYRDEHPVDEREQIPWNTETRDCRDEQLVEIRSNSGDQRSSHEENLTENLQRSENNHLPEDDLEGSVSRIEGSELQGIVTAGTEYTYMTTETTRFEVEQIKRDLELFTLEDFAARMMPGTQWHDHSAVHEIEDEFPSKPWCYASEHGATILDDEDGSEAPAEQGKNRFLGPSKPWCYASEHGATILEDEDGDGILEDGSVAPAEQGKNRFLGCIALPELYDISSPTSDSDTGKVGQHGPGGIHMMSDITSFSQSQASTGSFSSESSSGNQSETEDVASLSELSEQSDDEFNQDGDDESAGGSSVSSASAAAPGGGQFMQWLGSAVSSDSDDSLSTMPAPSKEATQPGFFKWIHGN